jgi:lipopolysaccharide exporter
MLGYFFTPAIVGFFAMAYRLVGGPVQLLTSALIIVFYERANRAKIDGNLGDLTAGLYQRLAALLMTPMGLLGIAAPDLVSALLGDQWVQAGVYLQWLVIWLFCFASTSPLSKIFFILNRQRELAAINIARFLISAGALMAGGLSGDATVAVAFFAVFSSLVHIGEGLRVMVITGAPFRTILVAIAKEFVLAIPFLIAMLSVRYFSASNLVVSGAFLALLALFAALRLKAIIRPNAG